MRELNPKKKTKRWWFPAFAGGVIIRFLCALVAFVVLLGCSGSKENPKQLGEHEVANLTGRLSAPAPGVRPTLYLYNGTEWNVTDVDILLTNNKSREERRFRFFASELDMKRNDQGKIIETSTKKIFIGPLAEGTMDGSIGDFLSGVESAKDWSWSLVAAYGFKK